MNDATRVSARGWWDLADRATFYPDDLPEDWQLSYFANCFRTTLLPASLDTGRTATPGRDLRTMARTKARGLARAGGICATHPFTKSCWNCSG